MPLFLLSLALAATLQSPAPPGPAAAAAKATADVGTCLTCHGDRNLSVALPSGESRSLYVARDTFARSVHGDKLACTDCHADMAEIPHPARPFQDRRAFTVAYYEQCKRCHFPNYSKTLDSVHNAAVARGDRTAPVCVDCHGAHDIAPPGRPRALVSQTCAKCHQGISVTYAKSVHGVMLLEQKNGDVPVCTDCHHAHDVAGPKSAGWRLTTPELCANCHTNKKLMDRYGLSTGVLQTYLADFHGMTASLQKTNGAGGAVTALCIDCHGVHDITRTKGPGSNVMQANLLRTCQRCHPGATQNFPGAWLSHYEPSWRKAPLVYGVKVFYAIFIPFMMGGLILQILLHLWRVAVNR